MRHVALHDSSETWRDLIREVDSRPLHERFAVVVSGAPNPALGSGRVEDLILRGYSLDHEAASADVVMLVPMPTGILLLASDVPEAGVRGSDAPAPTPRFRSYCVVLDARAEDPEEPEAPVSADEVWTLDDYIESRGTAEFVMELVAGRGIELVHIVNAKSGVDLLPTLRSGFPRLKVVVEVSDEMGGGATFATYATSRYGNLVDAFIVKDPKFTKQLTDCHITSSRIRLMSEPRCEPVRSGFTPSAVEGLYGELIASRVS